MEKTAKSKAYILDGHSRVKALLELKKEGHKIPSKLPVDYIRAATKKEAKEKLLGIASQYGQVTDAGFMDFINEANINISDLNELETDSMNLQNLPYSKHLQSRICLTIC